MSEERRSLRGKRVVVTGATGFIGSRLTCLLEAAGCRVVAVTRARGDLREPAFWKGVLRGTDFVFHLAAQTSASAAEAGPESDFDQNVLPMLLLLEQCRRRRRPPFIVFASTVTISGLPERQPVDEGFPDRPLTVYDVHKKIAEEYLELYVRAGLARGTSLRLSNVYGPGPPSRKADRGVLNRMIGAALAGETLTVHGKGDRLRDYLYVDDAARAFLAAARRAPKLSGRHFIVGSGEGRTVEAAIRLVAARVAAKTGRRVRVRRAEPPAPPPLIESRDFVADARRFRRAAGWRPLVRLRDGIDRSIAACLLGQKTSRREAEDRS